MTALLPALAAVVLLGAAPDVADDLARARELRELASAAEYPKQETLLLEALAIYERLPSAERQRAHVLTWLGELALSRGDPETAERRHRQALALYGAEPDSLERANVLTNLAEVAMQRFDLATAERLYREALVAHEKADPESLAVANLFHGLGTAARLRNDWPAAEAAYARALAIQEAAEPEGRALAMTLADMTTVALDQGQIDKAEQLIERAFAIVEKQGFESMTAAYVLDTRGRVAWIRDDPQTAQELLERGLALYTRLGPGTVSEAEAVFALGWTHRQLGRPERAARYLCRLIDLLEGNKSRRGGGEEARSEYAAMFGNYYADCLDLLVQLGRGAEAFQMLERARARRFLGLLAERDVAPASSVPPELAEEARRLRHEYDQVQAQLWGLGPSAEPADAAALRQRLLELRRASDVVVSRIRERSPELAALQYPRPMNVEQVQRALDPGTVLLSYSVGPAQTLLFVVSRDRLAVHALPVGDTALRARIEAFRGLIERGRVSSEMLPALVEDGRALYATLVRPAAREIAAARRVLLCPDGPLHALPFGALITGRAPGGRPRFLAEAAPIHVALSGSVYAEMKARRGRRRAARGVVAFGDPDAPRADGPPPVFKDQELRSAAERGLRFSPLPAARAEVQMLRRLFPGAVTWLGGEATEERAKALPAGMRYLHFASHALLDDAMPLNSGLVLTLREQPAQGQDNGLLQAFEIFESVRAEADLVTLSACATGLGREVAGEGLVGLTRAFHYAGARSVLASLWSVSDASTADLMSGFYRALRSGATKDAALAAAQRAFIRDPRLGHPYHWAAFQLSGDWR